MKSDCYRPNRNVQGDRENIAILPLDIGRLDDVLKAYKVAKEAFGRIDILINNAGVSQRSLTIDTSLDVYA